MHPSRTTQVFTAALAFAVAIAAIVVIAVRPYGDADGKTAAVNASLNAGESMPTVLIDKPWGDGLLVLVASGDAVRTRRLSLSFVIDDGRGWRVVKRAVQTADRSDVSVGSLLLATSTGGPGQPAWSAAFGELGVDGIQSVEITWNDATSTRDVRVGGSYLVVRTGAHSGISVRYLDAAGGELAVVPVDVPSATPKASAN